MTKLLRTSSPSTLGLQHYSLLSLIILLYINVLNKCMCEDVTTKGSELEWDFCEGRILNDAGDSFSGFDVDFSGVVVQMLTKDGITKDVVHFTSTGFYSIPFEDPNRNYILKINAPNGWKFTPTSYEIDGRCNKDMNFKFHGFQFYGQVITNGSTVGPSGVLITLYQQDGTSSSTTTTFDGYYKFDDVLPAPSKIVATHPEWIFDKSEISVRPTQHEMIAAESFVIAGYDVQGYVFSRNGASLLPISNVVITLNSTHPSSSPPNNCNSPPPKSKHQTQHCIITSSDDGWFKFKSVPPGTYKMIANVEDENQNNIYELSPKNLSITVNNNSLILPQAFEVSSFSVGGRVLNVDGSPVVGASIRLKDGASATSLEDGSFTIVGVRRGTYDVEAIAEHLHFEKMKALLYFGMPSQLTLTVKQYDVCGKLIPITSGKSMTSRKFIMKDEANDSQTVKTNEKGEYCIACSPGVYELSSSPSSSMQYQIYPTKYNINVTTHPQLNIDFKEIYYTVEIKVLGLETSNDASFKFYKITNEGPIELMFDMVKEEGMYTFIDVPIGKYKVEIEGDGLCWKEEMKEFSCSTENLIQIEFERVGYILNGTASSSLMLQLEYSGDAVYKQFIKLTEGAFSICVPHPGTYRLTPSSCTHLSKPYYEVDTTLKQPINLEVISRSINGELRTDFEVTDTSLYDVQILFNLLDEENTVHATSEGTMQLKANVVYFTYEFQSSIALDKITIKPFVNSTYGRNLVMIPPMINLDVKNNLNEEGCAVMEAMEGRLGYFINGWVDPPLKGVIVSVVVGYENELIHQLKTDATGVFEAGPFNAEGPVDVIPSMAGYRFVKNDGYHFTPIKVSSVKVQFKVTSEGGDEVPLNGVQVILASDVDASYRARMLVEEEGVALFDDVPSGRYYLKPFLKEFAFEPIQMQVVVAPEESVVFEWKATQVAFSCIGKIYRFGDITAAQLENTVVEAVAEDGQIFDTRVFPNGEYVLKGLLPGVAYKVSPSSIDVNAANTSTGDIRWFSPEARLVRMPRAAVRDINFAAFKIPKQKKLVVELSSLHPHNTYTIQLKVLKGTSASKLYQTIKEEQLHILPFVEFTSLVDTNYKLIVSSSPSFKTSTDTPSTVIYSTVLKFMNEGDDVVHLMVDDTSEMMTEEEEVEVSNTNSWMLYLLLVLLVITYIRMAGLYKHPYIKNINRLLWILIIAIYEKLKIFLSSNNQFISLKEN